jgi:hypothetical protein
MSVCGGSMTNLKEFLLTTMVPLFSRGRRSVDRSNVDQQRSGTSKPPPFFGGFGGLLAPNLSAVPSRRRADVLGVHFEAARTTWLFTCSSPLSLGTVSKSKKRPGHYGF